MTWKRLKYAVSIPYSLFMCVSDSLFPLFSLSLRESWSFSLLLDISRARLFRHIDKLSEVNRWVRTAQTTIIAATISVNNTPTYPGNTDDIDDRSCVIIATNRVLPNIRLQIRNTRSAYPVHELPSWINWDTLQVKESSLWKVSKGIILLYN